MKRVILHHKVASDIDKIMDYYAQADTPELADEFYGELRHLMAEAAERPESFRFESETFAARICSASRIIFYFASLAIEFGFLLCAITAGIRPQELDAVIKGAFPYFFLSTLSE